MRLILLFVTAIMVSFVYSQKAVIYAIKPGAFITDVIPAEEIYRYPSFKPGTVSFKDGRSTAGTLNYNMLIGTVQFLSPKPDTLSLANEETIRRIVIGDDLYFYDQGYFRVTDTVGALMLSERIFFKSYSEKESSYGLASSTAASDNFGSILERRAYNLTAAEEMKLVKYIVYGIFDSSGMKIYPDKKKLLKLFPANKTVLTDYLIKNSADPGKKEELLKLMKFLAAL